MVTLIGMVALLTISFANWRSVARLDRSLGHRLARLDARLQEAVGPIEGPPAVRHAIDPSRVYTIRTDGAPSQGSASAPVTIVEFGDFQ
jgi:hypothetical protein